MCRINGAPDPGERANKRSRPLHVVQEFPTKSQGPIVQIGDGSL
jgi:hypothetical protein